MAGFFHQFSFIEWRWYDAKGLVLFAAILLVLHKPWSWQRFSLFVLVDWISVGITFPDHPNHIVFSWIVNGLLLASLATAVYKERSIKGNIASNWYAIFCPWVRILVCMLYLFAVFHKLNTSYFNPDWSCSVMMHDEINQRIPILPGGDYLSIYGALIIELSIVILLLFKRTWPIGIIVGMLFHGMLALHPHIGLFSFSATMTALFTNFLPERTAEAMKPGENFLIRWRWVLSAPIIIWIIWVFRGLTPWNQTIELLLAQHWKLGFVTYYTYLAFGLVTFVKSLRSTYDKVSPATGSWRSHPMLIVFPILVFVCGIGPYIGLRTEASFSMFSNLHTENGVTNHLIMPSGIQVTNWQRDLVEIVDSNNEELNAARDKQLLIVYLDLRRIRTSEGVDLRVSFLRKGKIQTFDGMRPETYAAIPEVGLLSRLYLFFRPVERDPTCVRCKH
jgi:hypothetical protein